MVFNAILRSLRGSNLEIFKFGLYLAFPIGWMYYFGTNLDERFDVPDFWPTQEQSHKLPYDKHDLKKEVERIQGQMRERERLRKASEAQGDGLGADGSVLAALAEQRRREAVAREDEVVLREAR